MKKTWGNGANIIKALIIVILLGIVIYEAVMIYRDQKEYAVSVSEYDDVRDKYVTVKTDGADTSGEIEKGADEADTAPSADSTVKAAPLLDINFEELKKINNDFIGWLYFPALDISYPVVKEQTIDQYLYLTFDGTPNKAGSIFMDVLSDESFEGYSDMLFGHNMKNGSMFGSLKKLYKNGNENLLADDPYIYIYTEENTLRYRIFAYYVTTSGSESYSDIKNSDEYVEYINYIKRNSMISFPEEVSFEGEPSLLTLSTCSGQSGSGKRFVIHSVRQE